MNEYGPRCHNTPMIFEESDDESWWECRHCGHVKEVVGLLDRPVPGFEQDGILEKARAK